MMSSLDVRRGERSAISVSLVAALISGLVGWIVVFSTASLLGLIAGVGVGSVVIVAWLHRRGGLQILTVAAYTFAFVLLTWPFLWILAALITGTTLGD